MPRHLQHLQLGGFGKFPAAGFGPFGRGELRDHFVGGRWQSGQDIAQVGLGVDAPAAATLDERVDDGAALPGVGVSDEQPVFLADGRGPNGVFHKVVVDLDPPVGGVEGEFVPVLERVGHGLAEAAFRKVAAAVGDFFQGALDPIQDRAGLRGAHGFPQIGAGPAFAQLPFDGVEMADLPQDPITAQGRVLAGVVEVPPRMGPAPGQRDGFVLAREAGIGRVGVALQDAREVDRDDVFQAGGSAACFPLEECVASWRVGCPKVALAGFSVSRIKILDWRLMLRPPGLRTLRAACGSL